MAKSVGGGVLHAIKLEKNVGLGDALSIGLDECKYELIARMDTDDISMPDRFEKQLQVFLDDSIDICSSWVGEFENDEKNIISYRKIPQNHNDITKFAKTRSPINHPSVMYKKSIVLKAGGYKKMMWFEDYYLWARMIVNGAKFYNIQEPLVSMRAGYEMLQRRRGVRYMLSELALQREFLNIKFINYFEFFKNCLLRITVRVMPKMLMQKIYKKIRQN